MNIELVNPYSKSWVMRTGLDLHLPLLTPRYSFRRHVQNRKLSQYRHHSTQVCISQCMEQGHCGACRRKWRLTDTDLCPCGETQTMSHIVKSCPLTKLNGSLSWQHNADEDVVSWLTSYGS